MAELALEDRSAHSVNQREDKRMKRILLALVIILGVLALVMAVIMAKKDEYSPLSTSVTAESGDYLASIGRENGDVSIRAMGLANLFPRSAAWSANCDGARQGALLCNPRYELAQLNTLRPGETVFIPSAVDLTKRFATFGAAPIAIVVDTRAPSAPAIAAVYVRESERLGRSDTVWLTDGRSVRQYLPNRIDDQMTVSGIPGAVNVAVGASGAETALLITTRDLTVLEQRGYLGVNRLYGHCARAECPNLGGEARNNGGRLFPAGFRL
jgi:hypothetical protein